MRRHTAAGFTLIELMISAAILALISVYLTGMLTQQNRAYTVVDQVTETQSNMRAVSALMEREVRTTAFMAPEGAAVCGSDDDDGPDVLYVTDAEAYTNADTVKTYDLGPEIISGFTGTSSGEALRLANLSPDGDAHYDIDADGDPDSDFRPGAGVIVIDKNNPERGTTCGTIRPGGVDEATRTVTVNFEPGGGLEAASPSRPAPFLVAVPAHRYMVNDEGQLMRDDLPLADDVEDLQVSYYFDFNRDKDDDPEEGTEEDGERLGAAGVDLYEAGGADHTALREVAFSLVMRSRRPDPRLDGATFQATQNRNAIAGTDGFRRRVVTVTVRPRNVGHRWNEDV